MPGDWKEYYKSRLVTAEEALNAVKSGDYVAFAYGAEPDSLGLALLGRAGDVSNIRLFCPAPGRDFAWYDPGFEEIFKVEMAHILPLAQQMIAERRGDYMVGGLTWAHPQGLTGNVDVIMAQLSTPDEHGFCSFGASVWDKKAAITGAKVAIAEINANLIRTYGDNYIHVSEIDYFVEHTPSGRMPGSTDILGRKTSGPGPVEKAVAEHIGSIIKDGDTLEIGVGGTAEWVAQMDILTKKSDLGWHSENTVRGIGTLVMKGNINGSRKTLHPGKCIATAVGGGTKAEMDFINMNPIFEIYASAYVLDPRTIAANDNMVAINSALAIDLTGQIAAESIGPTMISGTGGQLAFAIGANLSKGGRNVTVMPSTARGGKVSRIVPALEKGTIVSVPRNLADHVVTEHGVAHLRGKTQRQRATELIAIAHPEFRAELEKEARKLYWP